MSEIPRETSWTVDQVIDSYNEKIRQQLNSEQYELWEMGVLDGYETML